MCWCVTEAVTGCRVCSSALSEQILSAGSESPPWIDPPASYRQTHREQLAPALIHTIKNQYARESKEDRRDHNSGFYIVFCCLGRGEL